MARVLFAFAALMLASASATKLFTDTIHCPLTTMKMPMFIRLPPTDFAPGTAYPLTTAAPATTASTTVRVTASSSSAAPATTTAAPASTSSLCANVVTSCRCRPGAVIQWDKDANGCDFCACVTSATSGASTAAPATTASTTVAPYTSATTTAAPATTASTTAAPVTANLCANVVTSCRCRPGAVIQWDKDANGCDFCACVTSATSAASTAAPATTVTTTAAPATTVTTTAAPATTTAATTTRAASTTASTAAPATTSALNQQICQGIAYTNTAESCNCNALQGKNCYSCTFVDGAASVCLTCKNAAYLYNGLCYTYCPAGTPTGTGNFGRRCL